MSRRDAPIERRPVEEIGGAVELDTVPVGTGVDNPTGQVFVSPQPSLVGSGVEEPPPSEAPSDRLIDDGKRLGGGLVMALQTLEYDPELAVGVGRKIVAANAPDDDAKPPATGVRHAAPAWS